MDFRKVIDIPKSELEINYQTELFLMGSCFIENIGKNLTENKFKSCINPFGVLYNPYSIAQSLEFLLDDTQFSESDIFYDKGLFHTFFHHSSFSNYDKENFIEQINRSRVDASSHLISSNVLIVTFGTSYVYEFIKTKQIVGNCHKIPAKQFKRYMLSVDDIVNQWSTIIEKLREVNEGLKVLFTVSPIRHLKDGAHGNQLSKATLLLAIDQIINNESDCYYFPSYEILLDELRDYRFYADDMIHPSPLAIHYIWQKFSDSYFSDSTKEIIKKWNNLLSAISHRPFNEETDEHKHFIRQTLLKLQEFQDKYPYFYCFEEIKSIQDRLL